MENPCIIQSKSPWNPQNSWEQKLENINESHMLPLPRHAAWEQSKTIEWEGSKLHPWKNHVSNAFQQSFSTRVGHISMTRILKNFQENIKS